MYYYYASCLRMVFLGCAFPSLLHVLKDTRVGLLSLCNNCYLFSIFKCCTFTISPFARVRSLGLVQLVSCVRSHRVAKGMLSLTVFSPRIKLMQVFGMIQLLAFDRLRPLIPTSCHFYTGSFQHNMCFFTTSKEASHCKGRCSLTSKDQVQPGSYPLGLSQS